MKLVKLYESVIREGQAQSCIVNFGKELFDPQLSRGGENIEPNTEKEVDYLELIKQFTTYQHGPALRPVFIDAIKSLKSCVSAYPEVLHPDGAAYRGLNIPLNELLAQYEDISDDLESGGNFDFIYKSPSVIQSWTADRYAAEDFAKVSPFLLQSINRYKKVADNPQELVEYTKESYERMKDVSVPIIITINTSSDDFLFKSKYFKLLSQHQYEEELLRISNQPTRVSGYIVSPLFRPVYGMIKALKNYERHLHKQE